MLKFWVRVIAIVLAGGMLIVVGMKAASRSSSSIIAAAFNLKEQGAGRTQSFVSPASNEQTFTICSYNCGGISDHYDYLRAAAMQRLMQERYAAEPQNMSLNEKIQALALKILFASGSDKEAAREEWNEKGYQQLIDDLSAAPTDYGSVNEIWNNKSNEIITNYKIRPVVIHDDMMMQMLNEHLNDLSGKEWPEGLTDTRAKMAKRIFAYELPYDIICLQEADYLDDSMFPSHYEVLFAQTEHSKNGVLWDRERFELVESLGNILGRAFAVHLKDKANGKTILVASGHITGSNPYRIEQSPKTGVADSAKGDSEIQTIIELFDSLEADLKIIAMDSNVTPLHPRLNLLKEADYHVDYENFIEPTCTNPYQVLNTRIDYIALKSTHAEASITNIPVSNVGLNSIQTNISDHKPIAAQIRMVKR